MSIPKSLKTGHPSASLAAYVVQDKYGNWQTEKRSPRNLSLARPISPPARLTERQLQVLTYLRRYQQTYRCYPVIREIAGHFGIVSPQGALRHLDTLVNKGAILPVVAANGQTRGYELTPVGLAWTNDRDLSPLPAPPERRRRNSKSA